jgi:hypothetical protein
MPDRFMKRMPGSISKNDPTGDQSNNRAVEDQGRPQRQLIYGAKYCLLGEKIIREQIKGEATAERGHWSESVDAIKNALL